MAQEERAVEKKENRRGHSQHAAAEGTPATPAPAAETNSLASSAEGSVSQRSDTTAFPIVGVGASAGGLEAFTQFLHALPADTGMAFVLVQHLSPDHESLLADLLSRETTLPVTTAEEGSAVTPDRVYVIPPNTYLLMAQGALHLVPHSEIPGPYIPIDHFLRALAQDQQSNAIAVILSGMGTDGTLGIEAIKAEGGITFAQAEASAQYTGMPHSAIATGSVDFILPPAEIAQALKDLKKHTYLRSGTTDSLLAAPSVFAQILALLKTACGTDFRLYRQTSLKRRLLRRMALHRLDTLEDYLTRLEHDPAEVQALYQDILIKVTAFFRDQGAFTALRDTIFPQLLQGRAPNTPIRIWVPGCATGEEVYSLAICLVEFMEANGKPFPLQLFGTDVNEEAVARARVGVYIENIAADVSPERLRRFFSPEGKSYHISKALRELCVFARQDITQDPPFSNLDLVSCRNVLIYMEPELQKRLFSLFYYALKPAGLLMLGMSESASAAGALFTVHDAKYKIYTKQLTTASLPYHFTARGLAPVSVGVPHPGDLQTLESKERDVQQQADHLVLETYAPPSVILNREFEIIHFRGDTNPFLVPAPGKASFHILKMVREGVLADLSIALTEANREGEPVIKTGLQVVHHGTVHHITLRVLPFSASGGDRYFLVLFEETSELAPRSQEVRRGSRLRQTPDTLVRENERLLKELTTTREYLQTLIEERETANEELQSAHEESLSTNEELQSINEEMETAKEELQSSNEELTTLNEELQSRNATLAHLSNDLTNLLTVIHIPIVMVDRGLRIRRFTPAAGTILNLLPGDLGRPITDLRLGIPVPDFERLIDEAIDTPTVVQRDVQAQEYQWYALTIRPYQTVDNQIDGAVITFIDISLVKGSELRYRQLYEQGFTTTSDAIVQLDVETGHISEVNPSFLSLLGWPREEVVGNPLWEVPVFHPIAESEDAFRTLTSVGYRRFEDLSLPTKEGRPVNVELVSTLYPAGHKEVIQLRLHDLTERKRAEEALRMANQSLVRTNEDLRQFAYAASHDLREPLRQISIYVQLLATTYEGQLDAKAHQYLDICVQGAQHMQLLLHDLLAYVQISEAEGEPPLIDSNLILQQTLENLQAAIIESEAIITTDLLPTIRVHEVHLLQLFQNLLSNALKYRSEQPPLIHVSATRRAGMWVFGVRDNGIGIEPQYHARIFSIFTRLLGHEYAGTGIGLAICHKIVERYGGRIWVESEAGKGATFYFTLSDAGRENSTRG